MSETFFIMFESTNATLEQAKEVLETAKFKMSESDGELICSQFASQEFKIHFATEAFVQEEATEITEGSEHEAAIKLCDARFEVSIPDLDEALDEMNTLIELQGTLQDVSNGYLFTHWNGNLLPPQT